MPDGPDERATEPTPSRIRRSAARTGCSRSSRAGVAAVATLMFRPRRLTRPASGEPSSPDAADDEPVIPVWYGAPASAPAESPTPPEQQPAESVPEPVFSDASDPAVVPDPPAIADEPATDAEPEPEPRPRRSANPKPSTPVATSAAFRCGHCSPTSTPMSPIRLAPADSEPDPATEQAPADHRRDVGRRPDLRRRSRGRLPLGSARRGGPGEVLVDGCRRRRDAVHSDPVRARRRAPPVVARSAAGSLAPLRRAGLRGSGRRTAAFPHPGATASPPSRAEPAEPELEASRRSPTRPSLSSPTPTASRRRLRRRRHRGHGPARHRRC